MGRQRPVWRKPPGRAAAAVLLLAVSIPGACRRVVGSLGHGPREASVHANGLLSALASRFGDVERDPSFEALRPRLARSALVPSRLHGDRTLWTRVEGSARVLEFAGFRDSGRYRLTVRPGVAPPDEAAEYRGVLHLERIGDAAYEWRMRDELAVGAVRPEDLARTLTTAMLAAESIPHEGAAQRLQGELPRTTAALGPLFTLTSMRRLAAPGGGAIVLTEFGLDPDGRSSAFPRYARYLQKYFGPMRLDLAASDATGARWWEIRARDGRVSFRCRVHDGDLAPLEGPARRMPGVVQVRGDVSMKSGMFRVGARGLEAEVRLVRRPSEKAFDAWFRREPDWQLPFFIEPFLRGPLGRPFEGEGALLGLGVVGRGGAQTLLTRDYRVAVKESWIVRWLGGLSSDALDEFRRGAEEEADRFYGLALGALRADALALASAGGPESTGSRRPHQQVRSAGSRLRACAGGPRASAARWGAGGGRQ